LKRRELAIGMITNRREGEDNSEEDIETEAEEDQAVGVVMITMEEEEVVTIAHLEDLIVLDRVIKVVIGNLTVHIEERINQGSSKTWSSGEIQINREEGIIIVMIIKTGTGETPIVVNSSNKFDSRK